MKVGINTLFLIPGEVGGTETYLRQTLISMAEHFPNVNMVLFTNRENDPVLRGDLGKFGQVSFDLLDFAATNRYTRIIKEQIDLPLRVRRSGVELLWSPGYTASFASPCPQVVTIHDMQYKTHPQDLTFLARLVTDTLVKMASRRCRRIIAVSQFSKDEIVKYTGAGPDKVDVVYEAANPVFGAAIPDEERRKLLATMLPGDKPYLLTVANTYPHKNIHALVRAFGALEKDIPHNLVLVGNPRRGEGEVQAALKAIPDASRVIRLKQLSMQQLAPLYQGCDAFVFPSLYEGFGLPVLEAMMAGVPVVTTRKASIPEVGGKGVLYFDPDVEGELGVRIREALNLAGPERLALLNRAREISRGFYWKWTAQRTLDTFRKCTDWQEGE